ncbi:hypothetical protein JCM11641_003334 [Rhodosporidiobolus odoratus]
MGLFSRKKGRDPSSPPGPSPSTSNSRASPAPSTFSSPPHPSNNELPSPTESTFSSFSRAPLRSQPSPSAPSSRFNPFRMTSASSDNRSNVSLAAPAPLSRAGTGSQSSWDDAGVPLGGRTGTETSPNLPPVDRYKLFGGRGSASTVSLPLYNAAAKEEPLRERQSSAMAATEAPAQAQEKTGWNRWRMGRAGKQRQGSVASFAGIGIGGAGSEESGFVVKSFRTVSRVHEDPVARDSFTSLRDTASPPLPALPLSAPPLDAPEKESLRNSIDYSQNPASRSPVYPRRPSLNTLGGAPTSHAWERAPSPTITAEAFHLASARTKSSVSLASSFRDDFTPPMTDVSRPRFEPQRPSSRTSRRNSSYSDVGLSSPVVGNGALPSVLQPPRPSFALGKQHSNGSSSSVHSRADSAASIGSYMLGSNGLPQPPSHASPAQKQLSMTASPSGNTVGSYFTTPEGSPLGPSQMASPSQPMTRPAPVQRLSSGDEELRLIAAYGDSITSSPPCASPVEMPASMSSFSLSSVSPPAAQSAATVTPRKASPPVAKTPSTAPKRLSSAPAVAVQPPTPVSVPGFSSSSITAVPKRTSSLAPDAVKAALGEMGIGPRAAAQLQKKGGKAVSRGGWVDSSDEEEQERLSISDEEGDSSDDDLPLAQVQSRSSTDLSATLKPTASRERLSRPTLTLRQPTADATSFAMDGAADSSSPASSGFALATAPTGAALGRKGSNRRSMSTFSLSTSRPLVLGGPTTSLPPSPTRSILNRPLHQPRSISNPSAPSTVSSFIVDHSPSSSLVGTPSYSPVPALPFVPPVLLDARDSSSSSGSGTGSSSSVPLTPNDLSPSVSGLGLKIPPSSSSPTTPTAGRPSVKFDAASLASNSETQRWNKGRRMSAFSSTGSVLQPPPPLGGPPHHRSNPSLPTFASSSASPSARSSVVGAPRASFAGSATRGGPGSSLGTSPLHSRPGSTITGGSSTPGTSASIHGVLGSEKNAHERMKARHKAEALEALRIGRDLNNPSGLLPDEEERLGESEDDDEPLASLPNRGGGSMIGGQMGGGGSMLGGMSGMGGMGGMPAAMGMGMGGLPMGMGVGGAYSPLAMAPPGVDPYLYASLPPDQKMSLHQRAQQMMAMMQQAALQARAESVAGSAIGGDGGGSMVNGGGAGGQHVRGSMSMGGLDMMGMGMPQRGGMGHQHSASLQFGPGGGFSDPYGTFPRNARLPPFAPPHAMSQAFFQALPATQSMHGMPAYAGSAFGFGAGDGGSMLGLPGGQQGRASGRAASTIGMGQRR